MFQILVNFCQFGEKKELEAKATCSVPQGGAATLQQCTTRSLAALSFFPLTQFSSHSTTHFQRLSDCGLAEWFLSAPFPLLPLMHALLLTIPSLCWELRNFIRQQTARPRPGPWTSRGSVRLQLSADWVTERSFQWGDDINLQQRASSSLLFRRTWKLAWGCALPPGDKTLVTCGLAADGL